MVEKITFSHGLPIDSHDFQPTLQEPTTDRRLKIYAEFSLYTAAMCSYLSHPLSLILLGQFILIFTHLSG